MEIPGSFPSDIMNLFFENIMHTVMEVILGSCYYHLSQNTMNDLNKVLDTINATRYGKKREISKDVSASPEQ